MEIAALPYMSIDEVGQSFQTTQLEQAYERALRQCERIYEEEKARTLRVQLLLLEDENDTLQDQVVENEVQLDKLEDGKDAIQQQLAEAEADLKHVQKELRNRTRELEHRKAEMNSLHATTSDSAKILTEKLALAREVANMRPELEHLRSQVVTQSNLLSEKLSLQREVSSLQVELETEKRAAQRKKSQAKIAEEDSETVAQIETLKKEIAKEKREATKSRNKAADFEAQKEMLENKLEAFRSKLRSTKDQLKEVHAELEEAQSGKARPAGTTATKTFIPNPRKRPVARFDPDMTIGTPGHGGQATKKAKTSALPGDKSAFSITPFLNRTISMLPESPSATDENEAHSRADDVINTYIDALAAEAESGSPKQTEKAKAVIQTTTTTATKTAKATKANPLKESTVSNVNAVVSRPRLEKVTEEGDEENTETTENPTTLPVIEQVKKKQKLLGQRRSLFDDDEGAALKPKAVVGLGLRGGGAFAKVPLGGKGKMLAEFSPLKKDRRTAAASFLG